MTPRLAEVFLVENFRSKNLKGIAAMERLAKRLGLPFSPGKSDFSENDEPEHYAPIVNDEYTEEFNDEFGYVWMDCDGRICVCPQSKDSREIRWQELDRLTADDLK
jgi:hypothetical protein